MQPYEQRMLVELGQLDERVEKLTEFCATKLQTLDKEEQQLLEEQLHYMKEYQKRLKARCEKHDLL